MKVFQRLATKTRLTSVALLLSLCPGLGGAPAARAQTLPGLTQTTQALAQAVKVSPDLLQLVGGVPAGRRVRVLVQSSGLWGLTLDLLLFSLGARTTRAYQNFQVRAVDIPAGNVLTLAASSLVSFVSNDRAVLKLGHLSAATGADAAREASPDSAPAPDGAGVGVAVVDSGVYAGHRSFLDRSNRARVVVSRDFTGEGRT
ncbi:MAG TPA: hypothetical protein VF654_17995, partial [Pyrinomonadaceae bacterium]